MRLRITLTNHSAAEIVSTNQHRVFNPCDHDDVKAPIFGHKNHVTPHKRWIRILGIVLKNRVEPGYEWDAQTKAPVPSHSPEVHKKTHTV